jgi:type II secretory pathway pseudopilin PulG
MKKRTNGFTLIELMLAMTFISFLLIGIAMAVIQMTGTYNRGLALKEVNQAARAVSDSLHTAASEGTQVQYVATSAGGNGRICFGTYSYIWNIATASDPIKYASDPSRKIQLVRVPDAGGLYCAKPTGTFTYKDIQAKDTSITQELVDPGEHSLAIGHFEFLPSMVRDDDTIKVASAIYTLNYTIIAGDVSSMKPDLSACLETSVTGSNLNYCNVQQFSIVLRI